MYALPLGRTAEVKWTSMGQTLFAIGVRCAASDGCVFQYHYTGASSASQRCRSAITAQNMTGKRRIAFQTPLPDAAMCYSDLPGEGLFVSSNSSSPFGVEVGCVSESPLMPFWMKIHSGRNALELVRTKNQTYAPGTAGRERLEWFATWGQLPDAFTQPLLHGNGSSSTQHVTQVLLGPSWTDVVVMDQRSLLEVWGEVGGFWASLIGLALNLHVAVAVALYCFGWHVQGDDEGAAWLAPSGLARMLGAG